MLCFQTFRLVAVKVVEHANENHTDECATSNIASVALLRGACEIVGNLTVIATCSPKSFMWAISHSEKKEVDGYKLVFNQNQRQEKVKGIRLQGYDINRDEWITVGSSGFRRVREGIRILETDLSETGDQKIFDHRAPWPLVFYSSWDSIESGIFLIAIAVSFIVGRAHFHQNSFIAIVLALSVNMAIVMIGYVIAHQWAEAFAPGFMMLGRLCSSICFLRKGRLIPHGMLCYGVFVLAVRLVNDCALFSDCRYFAESFEYCAAVLILAGGCLYLRGRHYIRCASRSVEPDQRRFDAAWQSIADSIPAQASLVQLESLSAAVNASRDLSLLQVRHFHHRRLPPPSSTPSLRVHPGLEDPDVGALRHVPSESATSEGASSADSGDDHVLGRWRPGTTRPARCRA
jgi:hypothetical protein